MCSCPDALKPEHGKDPRPAIAEAFLDLAVQADLRGEYFEANTWRRAAALAVGFVVKPGTGPR